MASDAATASREDVRKVVLDWALDVRATWREHWQPRPDHRYGQDFAAFLGERLLTDCDLREVECDG